MRILIIVLTAISPLLTGSAPANTSHSHTHSNMLELHIRYNRDEYYTEIPGDVLVGDFVQRFLQELKVTLPLKSRYGHPIALGVFAGYFLDLDKTFEAQQYKSHYQLNIFEDTGFQQPYTDTFETMMSRPEQDERLRNLSLKKIPNQYTPFRNLINKGPEHYYQTLMISSALPYLSALYSVNLQSEITARFDQHGVFVRNLFRSTEFDTESQEESSIFHHLNNLCHMTFPEQPCQITLTYLFKDASQKTHRITALHQPDGRTERLQTQEQENDIWNKCGEPVRYHVEIVCNGHSASHDLPSMINAGAERAAILNSLLTQSGDPRQWIKGGKDYMLLPPTVHQELITLNLIPVDYEYYNPWFFNW